MRLPVIPSAESSSGGAPDCTSFPPTVLSPGAPHPFTGFPRPGSPTSSVRSGRYDFLPPLPPHFVFLRLAVPHHGGAQRTARGEYRLDRVRRPCASDAGRKTGRPGCAATARTSAASCAGDNQGRGGSRIWGRPGQLVSGPSERRCRARGGGLSCPASFRLFGCGRGKRLGIPRPRRRRTSRPSRRARHRRTATHGQTPGTEAA